MDAKADDATGVLIHYNKHPMASERHRFAAEEIHGPQAVLHVTQERQPGRTAAPRDWPIVYGQDSANEILVNVDAKRPRDD